MPPRAKPGAKRSASPHASHSGAKTPATQVSAVDRIARPAKSPAPTVSFVVIDENAAGQRLDNFLLNQLRGVPKSHVYRIVRAGEVRVNKGRADVAYRLALADVVRIPPVRMDASKAKPSMEAASRAFLSEKPESARGVALENFSKLSRAGQVRSEERTRTQCTASTAGTKLARAIGYEKFPVDILFEDEALLAINKPAGMAVHGGSGISFGVIEALRALRPEAKFLELVHRIDRETSGVLLLAKKRSALTAMHAMLRGEGPARVEKHYYALVTGAWPDQRRNIRTKLSKYLTDSGERRVSPDEEDGQESHTIVSRVERFPGATLLDCEIRTGRTHQIRVHLASLGYPLIGDDKYGDFKLNKHVAAVRNGGLKRMFLHACSMAFSHPLNGNAMTIDAPLARDLTRYLEFLRAIP